MIKEYIDKLILENNQSLEKLEREMQELIHDLECNRKWMEKLQREKNLDTNIFSPRSIDTEIKEKLDKAQIAVNKLNQNIEHTRVLMEEHIKKKLEYEKLLAEADRIEEQDEIKRPDSDEKTDDLNSSITKILSELYMKTEICLATINSDRNKCRNELKNMKRMIKDYAKEIENK